MHNIKDIRQNSDQFKKDLDNRFVDIDLNKILSLDESNRKLIQKKEALEKEKKDISKIKDPSLFEKSKLENVTGSNSKAEAKIAGITPAELILSGKKEDSPPNILLPICLFG